MKRSRPAGKSLIELLVVLSVLSVVLGLSATSLATLFRLRNQLSRDREQGATLSRLASRLRQDVHESASVSLVEGCVFALPDGKTVHYSFSAPHVLRELRKDDAVLHRDRFTLSKHATAVFEQDSNPSIVRLTIRPVEVRTRRSEMPRTATIEVAVGLNRAVARNERQP